MRIIDSVRLIHPATNTYPISLEQVRAAVNYALPTVVQEEDIIPFGYYLVHHTPRPSDSVAVEGWPEMIDGIYYQTWQTRPFTEGELTARLTQEKHNLSIDIDTQREKELSEGVSYNFPDGSLQHIQIRTLDRINLIGLRIEASSYITASDPDPQLPLLEFRTLENRTYWLTPRQVWELTQFALHVFKEVMHLSWLLKDQVDAAETLAELPTVPPSLIEMALAE